MKRNTNYQELLKDPRWIKRRNEILTRDKNTCQFCGAQNRYMHVHHKYYERDKMPWEYEDDALVSICERCHTVISETSNELYQSYLDTRDCLRRFGFSDHILYAILAHISSFIETYGTEDHVDCDFILSLIKDAVYGTQNYEDLKVLKKLGVRDDEFVKFLYHQFVNDYSDNR